LTELQLSLADLLLWPVALPARGFVFVLEQLREAADAELYDPRVVQQRLLELQMQYELGEVPEEEYLRRWDEFCRRLMDLGSERVLEE
jgi:hypothetical protein